MIIQGDCIKGMLKLVNEKVKVDLIVTDPPYLMGYKSNMRPKTHKFHREILNDQNQFGLIQYSFKLMDNLLDSK